MIDGDSSNKWSNLKSDSWIKLDLGSKRTIYSLDIAWHYQNILTYKFAICVSDDGVNFNSPVFTGESNRNSEGFESYVLPPGIEGKFTKNQY